MSTKSRRRTARTVRGTKRTAARSSGARNAGLEEADGELKSFRTLPTFRLHLLARLSERFHETFYRRHFGLKLLEGRVIGVTGGFGQVSFKRLCEEIDLEKGYASRLINRLQARGLIEKIGNPADQRSVMLSLTRAGRQMHRALHDAAEMLSDRLLSVLSAEQRKGFQACLVLLIEQIRLMTDEELQLATGATKKKERPAARGRAAEGELVLDARTAEQLYRMLGSMLGRKE